MGYVNSRHRLAQDRRQRHGRRGGRLGLMLHIAIYHTTDAVGGVQEEAAPHRLVLR